MIPTKIKIWLCFVLSITTMNAQVIKTNNSGSQVDNAMITRSVTFNAADFSGSTIVTDVNILINWGIAQTACPAPSGAFAFSEETAFILVDPSGVIRVPLVVDAYDATGLGFAAGPTYSGFNSVVVSVTFDHQASVIAGVGDPVSGTFIPDYVSPTGFILNTFNGINAVGTWTLEIYDGNPGFPLCFDSYSLILNSQIGLPAELIQFMHPVSVKELQKSIGKLHQNLITITFY